MTNISQRFIDGLQKYNLTPQEIIDNKWKYCGGNKGRHKNYFKMACPNDEIPDFCPECVCGQTIKENCYITNQEETEIMILGNTCIKRFLPKNKSCRTCEMCGKTHKNRKVNRCNICK